MLSEKEKLEEELKLLEESLKLEVITQEEYEETKQRIEEKLKSLETDEKPEESKPDEEKVEEEKEIKKEEVQIKEAKEEDLEKEEEKIQAEAQEQETDQEEKQKKLEEAKEAEKEIEKPEEAVEEKVEEEKTEEEKPAEETKEEEKEEEKPVEEEKQVEETKEEEKTEEPIVEEEQPGSVVEEQKKSNIKIYSYIIAILILVFGFYFFFLSGNGDGSGVSTDELISENTVFIACHSDKECVKEGSVGTCANPGTGSSECSYIADVKVDIMVLNSNSCFNCETGRVLSILNNFFPNIGTENVDFETARGKEIVEKYSINALPAYILNADLQEAHNYYKIYNAFTKVGDSFVVKNTVANSNFYIEREEVPNKLDLFLKSGQSASLKAEGNLEEFWQAFDGIVVLEKHNENSAIVKELGINTFPAFLVNNKIKFSGVQAADKIKENFCQLNSVAECALELSKSLV
tara:strand:+ start:595 stop:1980 length:1386 start_codon:yes stop_codon:yes gene_type:complete